MACHLLLVWRGQKVPDYGCTFPLDRNIIGVLYMHNVMRIYSNLSLPYLVSLENVFGIFKTNFHEFEQCLFAAKNAALTNSLHYHRVTIWNQSDRCTREQSRLQALKCKLKTGHYQQTLHMLLLFHAFNFLFFNICIPEKPY